MSTASQNTVDYSTLEGSFNNIEVKLVKDTTTPTRLVRGVEFPIIYNVETNPPNVTAEDRRTAIENVFKDLGEANVFQKVLNRHGQIVVQNLNSTDPELYSKVTQAAFGKLHHPFEQIGVLGAPRKDVAENVTSVNGDIAGKKLYAHQEFSRFKEYPSVISFFSQVSPPADLQGNTGQSTTVHATELFDRVNAKYPEFIEELATKGLYIFQSWYPDGTHSSWASKFAFGRDFEEGDDLETQKSKAIKIAQEHVSDHVEFLKDNSFRVHQHTKPVKVHPYTKWPIIFSSIPTFYAPHYFDKSSPRIISYDNGEEIPDKFLDFLLEQSIDIEFIHKYNDGDLVLIDNYLVYHGRETYEGKRDILASFWDENEKPPIKDYQLGISV